MDPAQLYERYRELQRYLGWDADDARRLRSAAEMLESHVPTVIDEFYAEIKRHPNAMSVITGGDEQIERLKGSLRGWLERLFYGPYDADFVASRFRVGARHVEIGLDQVYTNVALSHIRTNLLHFLIADWTGPQEDLWATVKSLNRLLDLDLAVIEDAYQAEYMARQQRTERLATIGQVAGGIAHELRNPLNAIKTSVYYLLNARHPSPAKTADHLKRIDRQVGLADSVVTALSDFSKLPMPNLRPVEIGEWIRSVLDLTALPDHVEVSVDCPVGLPSAMGDAAQLQIVLSNLIRNARDAMPDGGRLTIRARRADGGIQISVADTGVGIAPDDLHRIMEPLYSTKARGIGLGLAITRAILEKHDGTLCVESEPGQGSIFTIALTKAPE